MYNSRRSASGIGDEEERSRAKRYAELTQEEISAHIVDHPVVLSIGAVEQHGPHLPLSVDLDISMAIAEEVALRVDGLLAPPVIYGARSLPASGGGPTFPGTIRIRGTNLVGWLVDIFEGYAGWGTRRLVIINGHYENEPFIVEALEVCREAGALVHCKVVAASWWSLVPESLLQNLFGTGFVGWHAEHAGVCETSLMLFLHPNLVRPVRVDHNEPPLAGVYLHPVDPEAVSTRGVLSSTTTANAEIGRSLFEEVCARYACLALDPPARRIDGLANLEVVR